jgi:glycosyltransferase involved in cell wall biosynthesis
MKTSVVINVHAGTHLEGFVAAADSVLRQDHDPIELVVVVSDAPELRDDIAAKYGDDPETRIVALDDDDGLSAARNAGAEAATGDVVVFTDDDVVAEPTWLSELVAVYETHDPAGVGGHVVPSWPGDEPWYLPGEFYWLVGVMHDNFVPEPEAQPVRNTFGCNISFTREAFLDAGGFREDLGKNQQNPLQGEEAELCERIEGAFWYTPDAVVRHSVDEGQLSPRYLLRRAFWQGYSKAALADDMGSESSFLSDLITDGLPRRLARPTRTNLGEVGMILVLTTAVGLGFAYGRL